MVRVRPLLPQECGHNSAVETTDSTTVCTIRGRTITPMCFDRVFGHECTQAQVYEQVSQTVETVLDGFNATIFAYGQTGTGKTHTMLGLDVDALANSGLPGPESVFQSEDKGLIPRSMEHIFDRIDADPDSQYLLHCSYLEIYNERVLDLLDSQHSDNAVRSVGLEIREDKVQGVFVPDLKREPVRTASDVFLLMMRGAARRAVTTTDANEHSSRSHTIFQLSVVRKVLQDPDQPIMHARLNLVDLAGSEKWRTHAAMHDKRVAELTAINQSLSTLGNCIKALTEPSRHHIPFRDSKLTRLLQVAAS